MSRRAGFEVVDEFERQLAEFCGAPYAVATDSCTNALGLSLEWGRKIRPNFWSVVLPRHTYVGVAQVVKNAGYKIEWHLDDEWHGDYDLWPFPIWDSAKRLERGMYRDGTLTCLSFHWSKKLPIGRGGAILLDDPEARDWLRSARIDGRREGEDYSNPSFQSQGWHCNMHGDDAARGLHLLTYLEDEDTASWEDYPDLSKATWT